MIENMAASVKSLYKEIEDLKKKNNSLKNENDQLKRLLHSSTKHNNNNSIRSTDS